MRADLAALPPLPKIVDKIDLGERFMYLDCVTLVARDGVGFLQLLGGPACDNQLTPLLNDTTRVTVDWNLVLRRANKWYDRLAEAHAQPTRAERTAAYAKIDADLMKQNKALKNWTSSALWTLADPRQATSEHVSTILSGLLLPGLSACTTAEDRGNMRFDVTKLAFALAEYRAAHGSYPAKLADLVPKYVAVVPKDIFSGRALHYKPQADGYLLYSVGPNGKDDGGRNQWDDPGNEKLTGCDDITVRIAAKH